MKTITIELDYPPYLRSDISEDITHFGYKAWRTQAGIELETSSECQTVLCAGHWRRKVIRGCIQIWTLYKTKLPRQDVPTGALVA